MNYGISFLTRNNLKLFPKEDKVALMPLGDGSASRARLVDVIASSIGGQGEYGEQPKRRRYQLRSG